LAGFLASFAIKIFFCLGEIQKTVTAKNAKNFREVREEVRSGVYQNAGMDAAARRI